MKLINLSNWLSSLVGFFTFWSDGGGGGGSTTQTSYSTNLPQYAQPYYEQLLNSVGNQVFTTDSSGNVTGVQPGINLPQQQVAQFNPLQQQAQTEAANLTTPAQFQQATQGLQNSQNLGNAIAGAGINQALSYDPSQITAQQWNNQTAQQYMSPYLMQSLLPQLQYQQQVYGEQNAGNAAQSIGQGTFSGSREALQQAQNQQNQNMNLANILGQGLNTGYQNAQTAFNAQNQANLAAQQATAQGQQYAANLGAQLGQAGLQTGETAAQGIGALGTAQNQANLANLGAQTAAGQQQQQLAQQNLNTAYQNAMAQYYYPQQQLQYYSDILRGNANALGSSQVQYAPAPSMASQVAGLGLGALGLAKATS